MRARAARRPPGPEGDRVSEPAATAADLDVIGRAPASATGPTRSPATRGILHDLDAAASGPRGHPPRPPPARAGRRASTHARRGVARRGGGDHRRRRRAARLRLRQGPLALKGGRDASSAASATRSRRWPPRPRRSPQEALRADRGGVRGAAGGLRPGGGPPARRAPDPRRVRGQPRRTSLPVHATATWTRAFARRTSVVEGTYRLNYVTTGLPRHDGGDRRLGSPTGSLTMWSTTQVPFLYQRDLAEALGITRRPRPGASSRRWAATSAAGLDLYPIDIIAALLARRVAAAREDRVRARWRSSSRARPASRADPRCAPRRGRGRAGCWPATPASLIDNGAYVSWGSTTPYVMLATLAGLYRCPASGSTPRSSTPTTPTRARCAATATSSRRSPSRRRWTTSPSGSAWTASRSAGATRTGRAT